jgi:hypothetical protein
MYVFGYPGSRPGSDHYFIRIQILPSTSKKSKKTLDFYYFFLLLLTFYLGKVADVNVLSKSKKQKSLKKKKIICCWLLVNLSGSESGCVSQW